MKKFWIVMRMFLWMTFLTGILYPLLITAMAQFALKGKADGNFITFNEKIVGATLIGQKFDSDKYFWGRPSSIDYNPLPSGGSNLGPTSAALKKAVEERRKKIMEAHNMTEKDQVPAELLFASGSGLDPHITLPAAYFQLDRVAKARGVDKQRIREIIDSQKVKRFLGFLGEEYVNVLLLNKALDELLGIGGN